MHLSERGITHRIVEETLGLGSFEVVLADLGDLSTVELEIVIFVEVARGEEKLGLHCQN